MAELTRAAALLCALATAGLWSACGGGEAPAPAADPVAGARSAGWHVDTVGVVNLAEGDTINQDAGLLCIETTRIFPPEADGGEVFAWEFQARNLHPVKLLILQAIEGDQTFEILGESPLVVPRQVGANRFELPEPIPLTYPCLFGLYMPEEAPIPFRLVRNWQTLITQSPLQRPFIDRTPFAMYGWRYGVRVYWRKAPPEAGPP